MELQQRSKLLVVVLILALACSVVFDGSSFLGQSNAANAGVANNDEIVFLPIAFNQWLYNPAACYRLSLSHIGQGGDPVASPIKSPNCQENHTYVPGDLIELSGAAPGSGWHISGWMDTDDDASTTATNSVTMPARDHTASAVYAHTCYRLMLTHSGLGSDPEASPEMSVACVEKGYYVGGEKIQLSGAVPDSGWRIAGWSGSVDNSSSANSNSLTMPESAHTASVSYDKLGCYRLTLSHSGNGSDPNASPLKSAVCTQDLFYTEGEKINLSDAVPAAGWFIDGWTGSDDDGSNSNSNSVTMPGMDHSTAVNYKGDCYTLTLGHSGQGSDSNASPANSAACSNGQYTAGEAISFSGAAADIGWQIAGWTGTDNNASTSSSNSVTMPANNHPVTVVYELTCYSLTLSHSGQGSNPIASPANSTGCSNDFYVMGETVNLSGATPAPSWTINGWAGSDNNSSTSSSNSVTMPAGNHTASVNYVIDCYQLTLSHSGMGANPARSPANSSGCSNGYYVAGASINLSASPNPGWHVSGWSGSNNDGSSSNSNSVTMPAGNHEAAVQYDAPCYTLTRDHSGQGSDPAASASIHSCSSGQYKPGETINLSGANPDFGWVIASWSGTQNNASTSSSNSAIMPAANHTAVVNYDHPCYELTVTHTGPGSNPSRNPLNSSGCTTGFYYAGETIALRDAAPNEGYEIKSWTGTNNNSSTASSNNVTMPIGDHTAVVNYGLICYTLNLSGTGEGDVPAATPDRSSGCTQYEYHFGATVQLQAGPATGWKVSSWTGTSDNGSQSPTNIVSMPSSNHAASVIYEKECYLLNLGHTGSGSDPQIISPANSVGCAAGYFHYQEMVNVGNATPSPGWVILNWSGSDNNSSTTSSNTVTMAATTHTAGVNYGPPACYLLNLGHSGNGSTPTASPTNSPGCESGHYQYQASISLSAASPDSGNYIDSWYGTTNNNSTSSSNTVIMPAGSHAVGVNYAENSTPFTDCVSDTGNNASVAIPGSVTVSGMTLAAGDEIAIFTSDGICAGVITWTGSSAAITAWGDDSQTTPKDGLSPGEEMLYHIWDKSTDSEHTNVAATYSEGNGIYQVDGIHAVSGLSVN